MRLELQCCTVEQGKRLTELGVNAPATWYHSKTFMPHNNYELCFRAVNELHYIPKGYFDKRYFCDHIEESDETYPAYTVAELGAMFGRGTVAAERLYDAVLDRMNGGLSFTIAYSAEFLATCLIGAIERNLITPEQCATNLNH